MATKKKTEVVFGKQYTVIEKFSGWINEKRFDYKKGEMIVLLSEEHKVYARFVEEKKQ